MSLRRMLVPTTCLASILCPSRTGLDRAHAADDTRPATTMADIVRTWQKRQARFRTFKFEWTERKTVSRGYFQDPQEHGHIATAFPEKEMTFEMRHVLVVDGEKMARGSDFGFGHHRTARSSNLIVWFRTESTEPVEVALGPIAD